MIRIYACANTDCSNFEVRIIVQARPLDNGYYEFPNIVCYCGVEPRIKEVR